MVEVQGARTVVLDPNLKKRWVNALRSGKYRQGKGKLRSFDDKFCCLGVLCDIEGAKWQVDGDHYNADGSGAFLPETIREQYGVDSDFEIYDRETDTYSSLSSMNDAGTTFETIADIIEKDL